MMTTLIGWLSTALLIVTIGSQAFTQWKERSTQGVSHGLFVGQMMSSVGFIVYSALLANVVFVVSNCFILIIAVIGQVLFLRNRKREAKGDSP